MTIQIEKIFFNYILQNTQYIEYVESFFFKNSEIQFIYGVIKKYFTQTNTIPSIKQIYQMVKLEDKNDNITKEVFKSLFKLSLTDYDEEMFIKPKLRAWITTNRMKCGISDIVEKYRNIDENITLDDTIELATDIKSTVSDMCSTSFLDDNDDDGSDFDNAESHIQDFAKYKVKSGFNCIDTILGGGWDVSTLNVLMAETCNGKSLWMQNFAVKCANTGYNTLYITLEMSERKVMKRLGAMRLNIPINDYDKISNDTEFISKKIQGLNNIKDNSSMFKDAKPLGKIFVKFWAAGTATVAEFENYINRIQVKKNIKFDMIIVDYLTLVAIGGKSNQESLYTKGKKLAEQLRAIGAKYNCPILTAIQVAKDAWNANDITLESIPESKAIAETADNLFVLIRTDDMKKDNIYRFKSLKLRDGEPNPPQIKMKLNPTYLTLYDDEFITV